MKMTFEGKSMGTIPDPEGGGEAQTILLEGNRKMGFQLDEGLGIPRGTHVHITIQYEPLLSPQLRSRLRLMGSKNTADNAKENNHENE